MEAAAEAFLIEDEISCLSELSKKLDRSCLPKDVIEVHKEKESLFFALKTDLSSGPVVSYCLVVSSTMNISLHCHGVKLPIERVAHISALGKISSGAEVLNIISFLKSASEATLPESDIIDYCADKLEELICNITDQEDSSEQSTISPAKLTFIVEQLRLATRTTRQRRFSGIHFL